jgi:hypothetical protein
MQFAVHYLLNVALVAEGIPPAEPVAAPDDSEEQTKP